jgi:hypothetical protein
MQLFNIEYVINIHHQHHHHLDQEHPGEALTHVCSHLCRWENISVAICDVFVIGESRNWLEFRKDD